MKRFKNYLLWGMLSIMLQCSVVIYLDKVYFRQSSDFVLTEVKKEESKEDITVSIPNEADNIKVSYDGKYATYNINEKFYLIDVKSGTSTEILTSNGDVEVLYSTWLPDRNGIAIAENKRNDSGKKVVDIINYNAETGLSVDVKEICSYMSGMKVNNIATSISAGVTYVSVESKGKGSNIYRIDIEHSIDTVESKIEDLSYMNVFPSKDVLLYNDASTKRFYGYVNGKVKKINFNYSGELKLLALYGKDKIYMGEVENGKVNEVLWGTLDSDVSTWQSKKLDEAVALEDIYINKDEEIFINDKSSGKITRLDISKSIEYDGKLVTINNKIIASIDNEELCIKRISK